MIINKFQSQLLKTVKVDLQIYVSIYNQLYVPLSYITTLQKIIILIAENRNSKTNYIVYLKVLFRLLNWHLFMKNQA